MFEGIPSKDKDPRKSLHLQDVPTPELGPGEAIVAVMASAINYNTVWTSIFEPVSTFAFLKRYGASSSLAAKHDQPYHVVGSDLAGVVLRVGPGRDAVEGRRRGRRALPVGRARGSAGPRRHDDGSAAAHLGLRDELRRPGRARAGEVQPADAQARAPDVGGGRRARAGQLDRLPAARLPPRREHEAGRHRPDLGRVRRPRRLRHAVRAQRRRDPGLRRVLAGEGRDLPVDGRRADHRPHRRGLPVLEGRRAAALGVEAVRQEDPRAHRRRGHRHRLRAPGTRDLRRQRLRDHAAAARSSPARRPRATCTSTTTATCG